MAGIIEKSRRQQESEARRDRILSAARACFGQLGYSGATVGAIAREAGVSNGLLYRFFRDKDHLFEVVMTEIIRDWVRAMVPRDTASEPASKTLEGMFRRSVEFCRSHPLLPAMLRGERALELPRHLPRHLPRGSSAGLDRIHAHRELVASILRSGIDAGEFRADLDVLSVADVICQLQSDYSSRAYRRDPSYPDTPEILEAVVRFVRDAVVN
ncbi:MAG: TetR/AcrR family transcriptional regulator [Deltaproteobacteria bacterium]|nr:TetR/AcrR family transcriptional regulator [Deltaproteobacteria bacterium]